MSAPDLATLLAPKTEDEQLAALLAKLTSLGYPGTSWQSGDPGRTLTQLFALIGADAHAQRMAIAKGGFLDDAEGDWLTLLALSAYGVTRKVATFATGKIRLTCSSGAGPYSITVGQVWAADVAGHRFNNTTGGTLPSAGVLEIDVIAESTGTGYNVANAAITLLQTALPGVTVTNPAIGDIPGSWQNVLAIDTETDGALRDRCRARWGTLSVGGTPADAYIHWALTAAVEVARVKVRVHYPANGQVTVTLAGASGTVSGSVVTAVDAYLEARKSICADVITEAAVAHPLNVTATLYVGTAYSGTAAAAANAALQALVASAAIGSKIYVAQIIEALMGVDGAITCTVSVPSATVELAADEVAQAGTFSVTISTSPP